MRQLILFLSFYFLCCFLTILSIYETERSTKIEWKYKRDFWMTRQSRLHVAGVFFFNFILFFFWSGESRLHTHYSHFHMRFLCCIFCCCCGNFHILYVKDGQVHNQYIRIEFDEQQWRITVTLRAISGSVVKFSSVHLRPIVKCMLSAKGRFHGMTKQ